MKTLADAILARKHALELVDIAHNRADESARKNALTVVLAGGGLRRMETAGAANDLVR
jgi:NADH dehydrogenase FAD-containing subunit